MKIKVLHHKAEDHLPKRKGDIEKFQRNPDPDLHPFAREREYKRALNAAKMEKIFAKPLVAALDGHSDGVNRLVRAHNRLTQLFSGSCDGELRYWNLANKKCERAIKAHDGFVRGLCVSHDDRFLFSGGDDKVIKQWSVEKNDSVSFLDIAAMEDGAHLVEDGAVAALETDVAPLNTFRSASTVTCLDHHWTRPLIVSTGEAVEIWDVHRSAPVQTFEWGVSTVYCARFSPAEPNMFASSGSDNSVILYDLRANTPLRKCIMKMRSNALAFNPHYPLSFCVANDDSSLYTFDIRNMKEASHVHRDFVNAAMDVKFSPTGLEILGASFDGTIRIWERLGMRSRDVYHTRRMHRVLCCEFSPDSRFVVSGSADTNVRIWKAKASEALGPRPQREKRAIAYREALKKKFGHMPEIKRIIRHHHVPKYIKNAGEKRKVMKEAQKRKEENRIRHSKPGTVERTRATKQAVYKEVE